MLLLSHPLFFEGVLWIYKNNLQKFAWFKIILYLCAKLSVILVSQLKLVEMVLHIYGKAFTWRFDLTLGNFANFTISQRQSNSRCSCVSIYRRNFHIISWSWILCNFVVYVYLLAWASALLVLDWWAMRRPPSVERATGTDTHAFLFYVPKIINFYL